MSYYTTGQTIPVQAVASQQVSVSLGGQPITLNIYTRGAYGYENVYMDIFLSGARILSGVICQNGNEILRNAYFGVVGDFAWWDTQGNDDPVYTGLGTRWILVYYSAPT